MKIRIVELLEGAKKARGLTVIIDVFRAFSTACYAFSRGAKVIVPVADLEEAYEYKRRHPEFVLMGERGGIKQPGFDLGNSPYETLHSDLLGKTIVHTTSAGTQGLVHAQRADQVITGSFVNARAIVRYINQLQPQEVTLVAMGLNGKERADEDFLCAQYIFHELQGIPTDYDAIVNFLERSTRTRSFRRLRGRNAAPVQDFELCLQLGRFPFVLKAVRGENGRLELNRINI